MLVRELAVLNTQICKIEQHIFISRAGMMVLDELSSQLEEVAIHLQYVDEEVRQQPCLALIPWSGPLWVSNAPVKLQPIYYLTHAGRMLVREMAMLNTQIFTMEQPIIISFTPARRMVWEELSSQNEQYVDEEVGHRSCLALIPWSGPLCVPIFPVFSKAKPVYYLTRAGRMLVTELAVLNTQTSKLVIEEPTIHLTEAGRLVLDELSAPSDSHSQPNREDSGFPYEKLQLVGNWGSFHFHYWKIHYGRMQQNEEDMHHLCIVRGVERRSSCGGAESSRKKSWTHGRIHGLMSGLVKRRSEFTYYEDAQQVDISTTVEGYQERGMR
ncbi:uncharacterized protein LOC121532091 [Coregonus clupeaformis]|uniref:uncharacterized protein LOC121532091 n=1 Tax=Coregonus clupeaformis TaxID=59861 RepID=UPI001E1C2C91|nr:uncharacterized protein LOC121532091 [Coregonus clupeaformis]